MEDKFQRVLFCVVLALFLFIVWFVHFAEDDSVTDMAGSPNDSASQREIASIISECTVGAIDASDRPLLIVSSDPEGERRDAVDAFYVFAEATAHEADLTPKDTVGRAHLENIRALYGAHTTEFKKPSPNLDRARCVRTLMAVELKKLHACVPSEKER